MYKWFVIFCHHSSFAIKNCHAKKGGASKVLCKNMWWKFKIVGRKIIKEWKNSKKNDNDRR
jgi:hypothetical protein